MPDDHVFRWLLDVGPLWPYPHDGGQRLLTKPQWANTQDAKTALSLLSPNEQEKTLRFHFARDAKMCLGSCLLKRKAVSAICDIPWSEVSIGQDSNRKPCFTPSDPTVESLEFNVSHHGSLVALVGRPGKEIQLGVDIVKVDFEKDYPIVVKEGFPSWAQTYKAVFSQREINDIAQYMPETTVSPPQDIVRARLRHFSAHWCLKEAYVKMTGEALLSSELDEIEFRNVKVPMSVKQLGSEEGEWGQTCRDSEIWFRGRQLTGISLELQAFRDDYMLATAASSTSVPFFPFEELDFEQDILSTVPRN